MMSRSGGAAPSPRPSPRLTPLREEPPQPQQQQPAQRWGVPHGGASGHVPWPLSHANNTLCLGRYVMRPQFDPENFGTRVIELFGNGSFAYCATSVCGSVVLEGGGKGPWQVSNGFLLLPKATMR